MKLHTVPILNDYPDKRNNFIRSEKTGGICFLSDIGKMHLLSENVQKAIEQVFNDKRPFAAIDTPPPILAQIPPRPVISIEAYVTSVERLAKAIRG